MEIPPPFLFGARFTPLPFIELCHDVRHDRGTDQNHIIAGAAINELIFAKSGADGMVTNVTSQILVGTAAAKHPTRTIASSEAAVEAIAVEQARIARRMNGSRMGRRSPPSLQG